MRGRGGDTELGRGMRGRGGRDIFELNVGIGLGLRYCGMGRARLDEPRFFCGFCPCSRLGRGVRGRGGRDILGFERSRGVERGHMCGNGDRLKLRSVSARMLGRMRAPCLVLCP